MPPRQLRQLKAGIHTRRAKALLPAQMLTQMLARISRPWLGLWLGPWLAVAAMAISSSHAANSPPPTAATASITHTARFAPEALPALPGAEHGTVPGALPVQHAAPQSMPHPGPGSAATVRNAVLTAVQDSAWPAGQPTRWDFTLPTLEGDRFVTASRLPGQVLVNFWGVDCPPCLAELPLLQRLAQSASDSTGSSANSSTGGSNGGGNQLDTEMASNWQVLLVATDPPVTAWRMLQRMGITLPTVRGGNGATALMRQAGNTTGALPFTVLLHNGQPCARHTGALYEQTLPALLAQCTAAGP